MLIKYIHFASTADFNDFDFDDCVFDLAKQPVVSDAIAPESCQLAN